MAFIIGFNKGGEAYMVKAKIIRNFRRMPSVAQKEEFMQRHNIKFVYDSHYNMTVYAEDGILLLFPIKEE